MDNTQDTTSSPSNWWNQAAGAVKGAAIANKSGKNPIIAAYLMDPSISEETKQGAIQALDSGQASEDEAVHAIQQNRPDIYARATAGHVAVSALQNPGQAVSAGVRDVANPVAAVSPGRVSDPVHDTLTRLGLERSDNATAPVGTGQLPEEQNPANFGDAANNIKKTTEGIYGSTLQPIGEGLAKLGGTAVAEGKGVVAGIGALANGEGITGLGQAYGKAASEPVSVLGGQNLNMIQQDNQGNVSPENTRKQVLGTSAKAIGGAINTALALVPGLSEYLGTRLALNAGAGAALGGGQAATENKDLGSIISSTVEGSGKQALFGEVLHGLVGFTSKGELPPDQAEAINTLKTKIQDYQANKTAGKVDDIIDTGIGKGVKPSVTGKSTLGQAENYKANARDAVKSIIKNKSNLTLSGADGDIVTGELPKNLNQFAEAVDQTKRQIFQKYDKMAKDAGENGLMLDHSDVSNELGALEANKALRIANPSIIDYAKAVADRFKKEGPMTPAETQDLISTYNQNLQSFYRNPSYDTASKAYVDSLVVNKLRANLDSGIEDLQGAGYQDLKNQYGSLKAIEKDVNKRAIVDARKNSVGLTDSLANVASGAELVNGLLHLNPQTVATSLAMKGFAKWMQHLNNPNTIVKNMFAKVEKGLPK